MGTSQTIRETTIDTIVIGAGLAGLTAALHALQQGRSTLLLAKGMGSLSWTHGCIDVWPTPQPRAALSDLPSDHPYQKAGLAALEAATNWLLDLSTQAGYRYVGSLDRSVKLCTAIGSWNTVSLFPITMLAAEQASLQAGSVVVAGFRELRDFYPPLLASRLQTQGIDARPSYLVMPPTERVHDWNPIHLARLFDRPEFRAHIAQQLREIRGSARTILLPAVLGLEQSTAVVSDLQATSGALVGEIPTLPTVIPGLRLERLLRRTFEERGGRILIKAEVTRGDWVGSALQAVWSKAAARELRHTARHFILATGGIAGGGLRADYPDLLQETALDLPVQQPAMREAWFEPQASEPHAVYRAGIAINEHFQPLDSEQQIIASNVHIAGAAIAGADLIRQRCLNGVALTTGWAATQHLA